MVADAVREQLRKMRVTATCRFIAADRLRGRDQSNAMLTAIVSSIVLFLTALPLIYYVTPLVNAGLTALTLISSTLILAFSLIQYSNNDAVNAEQFHRSGLEINEISRQFEAIIENASPEQARSLGDNYSAVLQKYSVNHDTADYDLYRLRNIKNYNLSWLNVLKIKFTRCVRAVAPFLLLGIVIIGFVFVLFNNTLANYLPFARASIESKCQVSN